MRRKEGLGQRSLSSSSTTDIGKVAIAIACGIFLGVIWSLYSPRGLFDVRIYPGSKVQSVGCESTDELLILKADIDSARRENTLLKASIKQAQQESDAAKKQLLALSMPGKAGPLGTVKSLKTNPTVQPDENINPELAKLLDQVAINGEVIVGIANNNVREMVRVWFASIKRVGITNYLLVALDDQIAEFCRSNKVPFYRRDANFSVAQKETGENHAISSLKFHILREFLVLGYSVLLSDVDIIFFQNPFLHLYRDCDVEGMSDGENNQTAYGFNDVKDDPKMGWARYAHTMRIWVFNSGFFFIRPTVPSIELLDRVTTRLAQEKAWDQAVFNEELFFPSHPGYEGLHISKRVMDFYLFMNSKVMFLQVRKDANFDDFMPVAVHVNYHPDKYERMLGLVRYYVNGEKDALKRFPDGSG